MNVNTEDKTLFYILTEILLLDITVCKAGKVISCSGFLDTKNSFTHP